MAPGDYASAGAGKLKLKGVKDSKVDKRKKKKSSSSKPQEENSVATVQDAEDRFGDRSVMLRKLEEEDGGIASEERKAVQQRKEDTNADQPDEHDGEQTGEIVKTEAERRYEEQRRRRVSTPRSVLSICASAFSSLLSP